MGLGRRPTRAGALEGERENLQCALIAGVVALPCLIAVLSLAGYRWYPSSDQALEALGIHDVGGRHTPLVGAQSRFGYFHPGPLLFWVLAPFERLLGSTGILIGTALLNGVALVGGIFVARRRGGLPAVVFVALVAALLCRGLEPELLVDPWNPWVAVVPFFVYMLLAWSVAARDWATLPWLIGVGSFVVQAHVGYAPLVCGLGLTAAALALIGPAWITTSGRSYVAREGHRPQASQFAPWAWLAIACGVGAVLWLAPVVQQLTGSPGNLGEIIDSVRHPTGHVAGWATGLGIIARQVGPPFPFVGGNETSFGYLVTASTLPALGVLLTTATLGTVAWRRGAADAGRLAALTVVGAGLAVVAASRVVGVLSPYLVRWAWVIAAFIWLSIMWSIWTFVQRTAVARRILWAAVAVVCTLSVANAWAASSVRAPQQGLSDAIGSLSAQLQDHLDRRHPYLLTWVEHETFGSVGTGLFTDLVSRDYDIRVPRTLAHSFGSWRTTAKSEVNRELTVISGKDLQSGWTPPDDARRVARFDPLTRAQRARADRLAATIRLMAESRASEGRAVEERLRLRARLAKTRAGMQLARLERKGDAYAVYLASVK